MRIVRYLVLSAFFLTLYALFEASAPPIVRYFAWTPPLGQSAPATRRIVLLSDLHISGPDGPPERLERIVETINKLHPDIVLLAGDFSGGEKLVTRSYTLPEAMRPLSGLKPRIGSVAVRGNHDHWGDPHAVRNALTQVGVTVLENSAEPLGGLAIGGVDDDYTRHSNIAAAATAMRALPGPRILLSHSPDVFAVSPTDIGLVLAGHTHCGQIALPLIGPLQTASRYGRRFACGVIRERGRTLIVSAGVGTSMLPIRLLAPPDIWVIDIGGTKAAATLKR
jgi:predicted MPP superfamily phosphohydrolase